jgi:hypothetical protein
MSRRSSFHPLAGQSAIIGPSEASVQAGAIPDKSLQESLPPAEGVRLIVRLLRGICVVSEAVENFDGNFATKPIQPAGYVWVSFVPGPFNHPWVRFPV